jgi:CRISPR system Cascade subunit CasE
MFLSKLVLNERNKKAQKDLGNAHVFHQQVMHAFPDQADQHKDIDWNPRQQWNILFRQEQEPDSNIVLVQSDIEPNWSVLPPDYLVQDFCPKPFNPTVDQCSVGRRFRFRLRANPSKRDSKTRKTIGFFKQEDQLNWLERQGNSNGFAAHDVSVIPSPKIFGIKQKGARPIQIHTVLFQGILTVTDSILFLSCLQQGIGRGKSYGCGLLSIAKI